MATFDHLSNMNDVALKPRLLRTILKEQVPDEKHPFSISSELSRVITIIRTHSLLSESFSEEKSVDPKQIGRWKSAVDSWVDRILALVSSNMPDKCWAGICLLGFTCQECSSARFLASYSEWFQKLLSVLQLSACSHFVRVASCASISDLFVRLSGFPSEKKDGSSYAVRVVQQVLKLLNDDGSETIWESALHLLRTVIISFPSSIHRHYESVEYAIASKILSGGCSQDMLEKLSYCLAFLPKSKGDEESWSLLMQKILVVINDQLNIFFQGLEEETKRNEVVRLLVPPGKNPPPPLGNYILDEEASNKATNKTEQSLVSNISTLMLCCCTMLTNSYPVRVNVPVPLLLALVERVLMVNGSLPEMSLPFVTSKQQENMCSELPVLHSFGLDLLTAIIKGMGSSLLPYAASIVRLTTRYFKTCSLPELRIKLYSITRILLISRGVGMASCLRQDVINNALVDLSTNKNKSSDLLNSSNSNGSTEALLPHSRRKRKHGNITGSLQTHESSDLGVENPKNLPVTPVSLKIAALEALETLINVAGSVRSEEWRSNVDNLLITITRESFQEGPVIGDKSNFEQKELAATTEDFQLAALRALSASFLSFARVRPPYLAQGLELFRIGRQQPGTKLAEFCTHALLALEVLIHPRVLSFSDYPYANDNSVMEAHHNYRNDYALGQKHSAPFGLHDAPESDDDLCARWVDNGEEPDLPLATYTKSSEEPSFKIQDRNEQVFEEATYAEVDMKAVDDETIVKRDQPEEAVMQFQEPVCCTSNPVAEASRGSVDTEMVSETEKIVSDSTVPKESGQRALMNNKASELAFPSNSTLPGTSDLVKGQGVAIKLDHGDSSSEDGFPDIVDADPDSDSD
ncbi:hypothetical protein L6164_002975 [Bauhinia variegata]|uniref:Uncharacterized protein n=1 Tax=Bauhinia variegata TaxID=167791 RepID=A0ACB9Q0F5_BAUVA|nr:hypothetical protein L6164_002975 [Bauhinia variegata]